MTSDGLTAGNNKRTLLVFLRHENIEKNYKYVMVVFSDYRTRVCANGKRDYETAWSSIFVPNEGNVGLVDSKPCCPSTGKF